MNRAAASALAVVYAALAGGALTAPARLTEPAIRDFLARREAAWNARDVAGFAAGFTPDARFVDQARGSDNSLVPIGTSTLAEATAQAKRFFAKGPFHETQEIVRIEIAPDGRSARVFSREVNHASPTGKPPRDYCSETEHDLVLLAGHIRSRGQTETTVRCRAGR